MTARVSHMRYPHSHFLLPSGTEDSFAEGVHAERTRRGDGEEEVLGSHIHTDISSVGAGPLWDGGATRRPIEGL